MTRDGAGATGRPWMAALVAGVVGGLLGALVTSLTRTHDEPPPATEIAGLQALDRHVQELTAALGEASRARVMPALRGETENAGRVEPLQPTASMDLSPLIARLDVLIARLEASSVAGGGAPIQLPDEAGLQSARRELFAAAQADSKRFYASHKLKTYRQVAERYGPPDGISGNDDGSVSWMYVGPDDDYVSFRFYDGLCQ